MQPGPSMADMTEDVIGERHGTHRRRRSSTSARKRVRWADQEQSRPSLLVIVVVIFNVIFALLAVLSRWGLLWSPSRASSLLPPDADDGERRVGGGHEIRGAHIVASTPARAAHDTNGKRQASASPLPAFDPIQAFQVDVPLLGPSGSVVGAGTPDGFDGIPITTTSSTAATSCEVTLVINTFTNSFGLPFVGNYTPPACLTGNDDINTAMMNLTVQSQGRQFDRLFIV